MAASTEPTPETAEIKQQITQLRSDVSELTRLLSKLAESKSDEIAAAAKDQADHILQRTREMADTAQDKTREATEALESHIKEKPLQSALIALTIGLVFGALSRR